MIFMNFMNPKPKLVAGSMRTKEMTLTTNLFSLHNMTLVNAFNKNAQL